MSSTRNKKSRYQYHMRLTNIDVIMSTAVLIFMAINGVLYHFTGELTYWLFFTIMSIIICTSMMIGVLSDLTNNDFTQNVSDIISDKLKFFVGIIGWISSIVCVTVSYVNDMHVITIMWVSWIIMFIISELVNIFRSKPNGHFKPD